MVQTGPQNHHRLAIGGFGIGREFTCRRDDRVGGNPGDLFRPGRGVGRGIAEFAGHEVPAQPPVEAVVGAQQVKHRGDERAAFFQVQLPHRHALQQHVGMVGALEVIMLAVAEIGEGNVDDFVMILVEDRGHPQLNVSSVAVLFLQVPLALFAPAEPGRT